MSSDLLHLMEEVNPSIAGEVIVGDPETVAALDFLTSTNVEVSAAEYQEPAPVTAEVEQEDYHNIADTEQGHDCEHDYAGSEIPEVDLSGK